MTAANLLTFGGPCQVVYAAGSITFNAHQVDASNDGAAWVFQAPAAITITHLGFRVGARTGTPPTYRASLQGVTSGGVPDGTVLGGGTPASATFTPPADASWDGTFQWVALDNPYTTTRGQLLCGAVEYSSGTIDASNRISVAYSITSFGQMHSLLPFSLTEAGGSWSKSAITYPIYGVRTASARYGFPVEGEYTTATAATNGHRQAMAFTLPAGHGDTFQVVGVNMAIVPATGTFKVALWDATTELQAVTFTTNQLGASVMRVGTYMFDETTLSTLSFGTKYYVGVEVTAAAAVGIRGLQLDSSDDLAAFPGGSAYHHATYNGSAWSDVQDVRPIAELILADISEPAGGGGGIIMPRSLNGGLV